VAGLGAQLFGCGATTCTAEYDPSATPTCLARRLRSDGGIRATPSGASTSCFKRAVPRRLRPTRTIAGVRAVSPPGGVELKLSAASRRYGVSDRVHVPQWTDARWLRFVPPTAAKRRQRRPVPLCSCACSFTVCCRGGARGRHKHPLTQGGRYAPQDTQA